MASSLADAEGTVHWRNLGVQVRGQTLTHPTSGRALAGRLLAVLGPSGAGKSLLLHALAGLAPPGSRVDGAVWDAGGKHPVSVAAGTMALLEQDVPFFSELTVYETVQFAAGLEGLRGREAHLHVKALLRQVGLEPIADHKVGERHLASSGRGISGGEKRRLAVACAIAGETRQGANNGGGVVRAKTILADEPTTGLDTFQAAEIVDLLQTMAEERRCATVITIHQPRSSVWRKLDDVLLLAPGGQVAYCGPTGGVLAHFATLGHPCDLEGVNPAEFLVDLVSIRTSRAMMQTSRDKVTNLARLFATGGLGLIFGAQFGRFDSVGAISAASVSSRVGLLSFGGISMAFIGEMRALDRFAKEKDVIVRERAASRYGGGVYLAAKALAELPSDALFACLFGLVVHARCGLRAPWLHVVGACALAAVACASLGLAIGAAVPNAERAMTAGVPIMTVHMLTGVIDPAGRAAQQPSPVMLALQSVSPVRYVIEALCSAELRGASLSRSPTEASRVGGLALATSGDTVLQHLGIVRTFGESMMMLAVLGCCHLLLAVIILAWNSPSLRHPKPSASLQRGTGRTALAAEARIVPVRSASDQC